MQLTQTAAQGRRVFEEKEHCINSSQLFAVGGELLLLLPFRWSETISSIELGVHCEVFVIMGVYCRQAASQRRKKASL